MRKPKSCGVLIFRTAPTKSFLLMTHANRYDLPKGHVEDGESELECALRELEEETGFSREQVRLDPDFRFDLKYQVRYKRHGGELVEKTVVLFLGELTAEAPELTLTEHAGYEWFKWDPPHAIQEKTVDPLLAAVAEYWDGK